MTEHAMLSPYLRQSKAVSLGTLRVTLITAHQRRLSFVRIEEEQLVTMSGNEVVCLRNQQADAGVPTISKQRDKHRQWGSFKRGRTALQH
eukprot:5426466-Amphidinium_carterae.1